MSSRLRQLAPLIEAGFVGLFFIQALRYLISSLYGGIAGVSLAAAYPADAIPADTPGLLTPDAISNAIILLGLIIALPLVSLLVGRLRPLLTVTALVALGGRVLMLLPTAPLPPLILAEIVVGSGLLYLALLIQQRMNALPYVFIVGFAGEQLLRTLGNTLDPTLTYDFAQNFLLRAGLSPTIGLVIIAIVSLIVVACSSSALLNPPESKENDTTSTSTPGILTLWGAVGLGGLLFLQMSLLATPNALINRADANYALFAPLVLLATTLPLVPFVRQWVRSLLAPFDSNTRGWVWLIILALLLVIGIRLPALPVAGLENFPLGGIMLIAAQFVASLLWWWFVRPKADDERNIGGVWLVLTVLIFGLLVIGDLFTYEYAFVRDFAPPLDVLNPIVPNLLRGFRGLGLGVILIAALLSALPMIQATRRIPWRGGNLAELFASMGFVVVMTGVTALSATPPQVQPVLNVNELRIGTYNIHAGYSEFYDYNLEGIARTIQQSGADVILLQEVEGGRLTSYSADQSLWLARRLGMDRRFYPTNEGLRGLAVLSRVPIVFDDGVLLPSLDEQTGLQRVQIQPDEGAITLYNTALGLLLRGDNLQEQERNQREQLRAITEIIAAHIQNDYGGTLGRALLGGTFHNVPDSPLLQTLTQTGFFDPFAGLALELSATLERIDRRARVDYLWLWGQTLQSTGSGVIESDASDHNLAFVLVEIRSGE